MAHVLSLLSKTFITGTLRKEWCVGEGEYLIVPEEKVVVLAHLGYDKMAAFLDAISKFICEMNIILFWFKFHQTLFLWAKSNKCHHWFR